MNGKKRIVTLLIGFFLVLALCIGCSIESIRSSEAKKSEAMLQAEQIDIVKDSFPNDNIIEHGIAAPVGRGHLTSISTDSAGRRIVFTRLWSASVNSYLFINVDTGKVKQVFPEDLPVDESELSDDVIYDTIGMDIFAIDVSQSTVQLLGTMPSSGLVLSTDQSNDGTVFFGIYPSATLVSYNPATNTITNHGQMNEESWPQYLRPMAIDSSGWVYAGIAMDRMQMIGFNPATGEKKTFIPEENRKRGYIPNVYLGTDGKVYARADRNIFPRDAITVYEDGWGWHALFEGNATPVDEPPVGAVRKGSNRFSDGSQLVAIEVTDRKMYILDAGAEKPREIHFDYECPGVLIYTFAAGPDGKIYGATGNPLRIWCYDPESRKLWDRGFPEGGGHINQFVRQGQKLYGAAYSTGALFEYNPFKPFDDTSDSENQNPRRVFHSPEAFDLYGRPRAVLAHPDGRHILVGGNAARVLLGSGLLIYDIQTETGQILDRSKLIPEHGINALTALPDGDVMIGTTLHPPTAGEAGSAKTAMIYRFSMNSRTVIGQWEMKPDTPAVRDMVVAADGRIYGLAEPDRLFVFDLETEQFIHDEPLKGYGHVSGFQAPRCMLNGPDGKIYALFQDAVVRIEPETLAHTAIARPGVTITSGITIQGDRLYFGSDTRLFSCSIKVDQ